MIIVAFLLDIVFGDPEWFPHPVVGMGKWIRWTFQYVLNLPRAYQKAAGVAVALFNAAMVFVCVHLLLKYLPEPIDKLVSIYILYTSLCLKTLHSEAKVVKKQLESSLEAGRKQLARIVGRDTECLSYEEVVKAVVETVSENTSDGIVAPLLFALVFGPAGALCYKMINTMDSMVGYRNDTWHEAGFGAAKLDDVANWIPARLTAHLFCITAPGFEKIKRSFKTVCRDHAAHLSPNAGWPEAAAAGLLGIELGGGHNYFGEFVLKPAIGRPLRQVEAEDIDRVCLAMGRVSILALVIVTLLDWL